MRCLLLAVLLLIGCSSPHSFPQKIERPYTDPAPHEEQAPSVCHVTNDCPVSMLCKVATGQCVECLNEDHCPMNFTCIENSCEPAVQGDPGYSGDPFQPGDPDVPPSDPGQQPGDIDPPVNECYLGSCIEFSGFYLCLDEGGYIPDNSPFCSLNFEGCPPITTPFWVEFESGEEACVCIQECQWTQ